MTTATAPTIIATDDLRWAFVVDSKVLVSTGKHDYTSERRASILANEGEVSITVADSIEHTTFWMNTDEARLFAQAILDATA